MKSLQTTAYGRNIFIPAITETPVFFRLLFLFLFQRPLETSPVQGTLFAIAAPIYKGFGVFKSFLTILMMAFLPYPRRRRPGLLPFIDI